MDGASARARLLRSGTMTADQVREAAMEGGSSWKGKVPETQRKPRWAREAHRNAGRRRPQENSVSDGSVFGSGLRVFGRPRGRSLVKSLGVVVCRKLGGKLGEIGSRESLDSKIEQAAELPSVLSTQKSALPSGRPSSDGVLSPGRPCETPSRRWTRTRAPRLTRSWSLVGEVGRPDADLVGAPHSVDLREGRVYLN